MNIKNFIKKPRFKIVIVLLFLVIVLFFKFSKKEEIEQFTEVVRKNIIQKVSVTGQIVPLKNVDLQFQTQGKVDEIKVGAGDSVVKGDVLINLNSNELNLDVLSMEAAKNIAQANLTKILEGASNEEIQVYEDALTKAEVEKQRYQIALVNAEISLENVKKTAEQNIENAYDDALNVLSSAHIKIFNAYNVVDNLQRSYFVSSTQDGIVVKNNVGYIGEYLSQVESYLDTAEATQKDEDIDIAVSKTKTSLSSTSESLEIIREIVEQATYRTSISSTDKTSLDNQRSYINTVLSNTINAQQDISSTKISNTSSIASAKASLDSAQEYLKVGIASLEYAQSQLNQIKASPQQYDIDLYKAKLDQAGATLAQSKEELSKTTLISPCDGIVSDIYIEEGEIARVTDIITSLVCENSFQIEAEVPESDISKISLGDEVDISLDAFLDKNFSGVVNKIYPTETIIQGVIYYKIKVIFNDFDELIKSGMTTDLEIITQEKENVLVIPQRLITKKNQEKVVKVVSGDETKEVIIETGISNDQGEIEVVSGLKEGDEMVK